MSAYNGSGTFVISGVGLPYVTGTTISSTVANQLNTDLATGLSNVVTKDGQTTPTANIPMGGFKITGIATATATGDALSYGRAATVSDLALTQSTNSALIGLATNANAGTGASAAWAASNGTHSLLCRMYGTSFTTAGSNRQDGALLFTDGAGGMTYSIPSDGFRWYVGGVNTLSETISSLSGPGWALANDTGGGSTLTMTGFGSTVTLDVDGSILTTSGSGIRMRCVSAGVVLSNGGSSWAAISDYRAKNVGGHFSNSGAIIDAVPVHFAALKDTPETVKAMFLAHEVQAVVPYAVHGEKDGEKMQVLESTDPLVPILWAEVRDLRVRLAAAGL